MTNSNFAGSVSVNSSFDSIGRLDSAPELTEDFPAVLYGDEPKVIESPLAATEYTKKVKRVFGNHFALKGRIIAHDNNEKVVVAELPHGSGCDTYSETILIREAVLVQENMFYDKGWVGGTYVSLIRWA